MLPYFSCGAKFLQGATFTFGWKLHDYLFIYLFVTFGAMLFRFSHDHQVIRVIGMICSIERERASPAVLLFMSTHECRHGQGG